MKKLLRPNKIKKSSKRLQSLEDILAKSKESETLPMVDKPKKPKLVSFVGATAAPPARTMDRPSTHAVPFCYGLTELLAKEARLKQHFEKAYLIYLQLVINKIKEADASLPLVYFDFDHSIFSFLYSHDINSPDELIEVVNSMLNKTRFPSILELQWMMHTMLKLRKVTLEHGFRINPERNLDTIVQGIFDYFKSVKTNPDPQNCGISTVLESPSLASTPTTSLKRPRQN